MFYSAIFFICSVLVMFEAQRYSAKKGTNDTVKLYDQLHQIFPDLSNYYQTGDVFIGLYTISLFYFNERIDIFLNCLSVLYLLRSASFTVTILPKCGTMPNKDMTRSSVTMLKDYISFKDKHPAGHNDMLPSGHCTFLTLYALYISEFCNIGLFSQCLIWGINFILGMITIASRCHYSIDVLYAFISTLCVFQNLVPYIK